MTKPCPECSGSGDCPECEGVGYFDCDCPECGNEHEAECRECRGDDGPTGKCWHCGGSGKVPLTDADLEQEGQIRMSMT